MKRMTKKIGSRIAFPSELVGVDLTPDSATMHNLLTCLAAYEDTGLEPEEIMEVQTYLEAIPFGRFHDIMEAERSRRLVVLPHRPEEGTK